MPPRTTYHLVLTATIYGEIHNENGGLNTNARVANDGRGC